MGSLYLSAASKSSGKTTLALGLCRALADQGLRVQPFKKGPDYIDPMWLAAASRRPCYNLDFYTSSHDEIRQRVGLAASADLALVEGNKGLYDGMDLHGGDSNAAMARLLGAPVVLVLDCQGTIRGIAPLLLGYQAFDRQLQIAGVILNKVGGSRHESKLRAVVAEYTDLPVLGAVHRQSELQVSERHLGLVPSNEHDAAEAQIRTVAERVAAQVDLAGLRALAGPLPPVVAAPPAAGPGRPIRIGLLRDRAFGFYYQDDLDAMTADGAELVMIDALSDRRLPALDGLYIGGGFPETHMQALAANADLRAQVRRRIEAGLPTYAECGGLMYLCRSLRWKQATAEMVGVIDADCEMHDRPQGRGYARFREIDSPWGAADGAEIAAHEFHYSRLLAPPPGATYAYQVVRGQGIDGQHDGVRVHNLLAAYIHRRNTRQDPWVSRFLAFVRSRAPAAVAAR